MSSLHAINPDLVKDANTDDVDGLVRLINSAYRGDESRKGWTTEADFLDDLRIDAAELATLLNNPWSKILKITRHNEIVACAYLENRDAAAYIGMLSVKPTLQGAGLAKQLLAKAESISRYDWKLEALEMKVISIRTELIAYYARRGYQLTDKREPFPYEKLKPGEAKRLDLEFAVLRKPLV